MTCPDCGKPMCGVEYCLTLEDYDGVSEWACQDAACAVRIGRWTGQRLAAGELEPRYGRTREVKR